MPRKRWLPCEKMGWCDVMDRMVILFLHGFASSSRATKAQYFGERFAALPYVEYHALDFNPTPRDFEYMTTTGQIDRLRQYILDHLRQHGSRSPEARQRGSRNPEARQDGSRNPELERFSIIGSSYGGLIAVHYAHRFGGVDRMLLLAPGLRWLSGGLSAEQLEQWRQAGTAPVYHFAFERELPLRYDLHLDGQRYLEPVPPACPTTIIHGDRDPVVPIDDSRHYAAAYPEQVRLVEVDADHDLNDHLDFIWSYVESDLTGLDPMRSIGDLSGLASKEGM